MDRKLFNQLKSAVQDAGIKIVSVDVFDTLLLRDPVPEQERFEQISALQAKALNEAASLELSPHDFYLLRRDAARTVYSTKTSRFGGREATWPEIFNLIFQVLGVPRRAEWFALCTQIELEYETKRLSANRPLLQLLNEARRSGKSIVALSDMYLSASQIGFLIDRTLGPDHGISVYASGDLGYGKGCGELFRKLAQDLGVELPAIVHCGDNWYADYSKPKSLGLRAIYLPRPTIWKLNRNARTFWFDRRYPAL